LAPFDGPRKIVPQGRLDGASGVDRERVDRQAGILAWEPGLLLGQAQVMPDHIHQIRSRRLPQSQGPRLGAGTADGLVRAGHPGLGNGVLPISSGRPRLGLHPLIRKDDKPYQLSCSAPVPPMPVWPNTRRPQRALGAFPCINSLMVRTKVDLIFAPLSTFVEPDRQAAKTIPIESTLIKS
jgi:hypothetical protein